MNLSRACLFLATITPSVNGASHTDKIKIDGKQISFPSADEFEPIGGGGQGGDDEGCAFSRLVRGDEGYMYADGKKEMMTIGPNPRAISNAFHQTQSIPSSGRASDWLWQWGQFVDHDFSLVHENVDEMMVIDTTGDTFFPSGVTGITLHRSVAEEDESGVAQQMNSISSYINSGNVYGSDDERISALLAPDALEVGGDETLGTGRMDTSSNTDGITLLPLNNSPTPLDNANAGNSPAEDLFLAGDIRANEHLNLIVIHTLFVREHNRYADMIRAENPDLTGEEVFEYARLIVQSEIQHITYNEFLPALIGDDAIPPYEGYDPHVNAGALNVAAACAYRVGHTLVSLDTKFIDDDEETELIPLEDGFFKPDTIKQRGLDGFMRGLSWQVCQDVDPHLNGGLRNRLFGQSDDLYSRNIQRGRDHGIPTYNMLRQTFLGQGYALADSQDAFDDEDVFQQGTGATLKSLYNSPEDVDCFVGLLSEVHVPGALVGPTLQKILAQQFQALRDSDKYWYEKRLAGHEQLLKMVQRTKLSDIIKRNSDTPGSLDDIQDDVFKVPGVFA